MANTAVIIAITIIVLINTAQSIHLFTNIKTDCFGSKADNFVESPYDKEIKDTLLKLVLTAVDKGNRIDAAQLDSQHTGKLVGTAADDTWTATTSYIGD